MFDQIIFVNKFIIEKLLIFAIQTMTIEDEYYYSATIATSKKQINKRN